MAYVAPDRSRKGLKQALKGSVVHKAYQAVMPVWKSFADTVSRPFQQLSARNGVLGSFYYFLLSRNFDREHKAVLSGKMEYLSRVEKPRKATNALLRRNIHRLEKGLSMRPRRRVFALDFIGETVEIYRRCVDLNTADATAELVWAHDVLASYFEACGAEPEVAKPLGRFQSAPVPRRDGVVENLAIGVERHAPFAHGMLPPLKTSIDDMMALARHRRSVRWFDGRVPPRDLVDRALDVARMSPSACNRLPFRYVVLDKPELVSKAIRLANGTGGYAQQVPAVAVLVGDLSSYFHERDRHLIYIDGALSAMSFAFALETAGLGSCMINWSDIGWREKAMAKLLGLKSFERPVMLIAYGYPDETGIVPYSSKKDLSEFRSFNLESN